MKKQDIVNAWATIRKENNSIPDDVLDFMKDSAIEKSEMLNWCNKIDYKAMFGENQLDQHNLHDLSFQEKPYGFIPTKKSDYDGTKPNLFLNDEIAHWEEPKISDFEGLKRPINFRIIEEIKNKYRKISELKLKLRPNSIEIDTDSLEEQDLSDKKISPKELLDMFYQEVENSNYPRYTIGYSKFSNAESYSLVAQRSEEAQLQFIASKVNVNNISKTFKEDLLAMARVLGANFLEEK